ncbi:hypothetical protein UACE39S_04428 [Ureibacillus acetophenoni]
MKKVIIRTDASTHIGSGHVMRCLTIAQNLISHNIDVKFWMKELPGNLIEYVVKKGFKNINQPEKADLYIIDHYGIDQEWEQSIYTFTKHLMVIDDLANRPHYCDLLLDQNVVPNYETRYENLVPSHCKKMLGPRYLIMRDEFIEARQNISNRNGKVNRILVFMGGSDPTDETMKVIQALQKHQQEFNYVDIVVGNSNIHKYEIEKICNEQGYHYHCQINYMAQLMQLADFSIGAGGLTTWERCYVGLPSSSTIVANNQYMTTEFSAKLGAVWNLGWHENVTVESYTNLLNSLDSHSEILKKISETGLLLTKSDKPNVWLQEIMELLS